MLRLRAEAVQSSQYREAVADVAAAEKAYQAALAPVMATLSQQADYQAALAAKLQAREDLEKARRVSSFDSPEIIVLGRQLLACSSSVTQLEVQAVNNSSELQAAKLSLASARVDLECLRQQIEKLIPEQPDYVAAHQAVQDAARAKAQVRRAAFARRR